MEVLKICVAAGMQASNLGVRILAMSFNAAHHESTNAHHVRAGGERTAEPVLDWTRCQSGGCKLTLFRSPGELVRALLAMNVVMPLFALALNTVFDFTPAVKVALVALGAVSPIPPPIAKAVKSGGTTLYAMGLQIAIGLLAIVVVPLEMAAIGHLRHGALQLSIAPVAKMVFISIVVPIGVGIVHRLAPAFAQRVARPLTSISGLGVVACIVAVWISAAPAMWSLIGNGTGIAFAAFVLVGLAVGHVLGGP